MPHHDLVIIGSGSGNSLLTPELDGLDVAIVEGGTFGGTCLNVGCIPTKMFVLPADRVVEADDAHRLCVTFAGPTVDWPGIRDRIFGRIDPISAGGEAYRRSQEHTTLYRSHATFTGERRLALATGEELTADRLVVAAGSHPVGLGVDGLRGPDPDHGVHTSDTVMRLDALPPRMAVIGGGFVACEMAHVFAEMDRFRMQNMQLYAKWFAARGPLRVTTRKAGEIIWALASPDVARMLCDELGWSQARHAGWLADTLARTLLPDP